MSFFGKNIKKIRTVKNLSQNAFAELFGLTRASIGAYEEGRAEAKIDTVIQIANYFSLTIDQMLTKELTINELFHFDVVKNRLNKNLFQEQPGKEKERKKENNLPFVSKQAQNDYLNNLENPEYANILPSTTILSGKRTQNRAFEQVGSEMQAHNAGIHHGDILISKLVDQRNTANLQQGKVYVFITSSDMYTRRLISIRDVLELKADNPAYPPIKLEMSACKEIWEVKGIVCFHLAEPSAIEERVLAIEKKLHDLENKKS